MTQSDPIRSLTLDEYRALEEQTGVRHEWINGIAYAMAGGTAEHAGVKTNLTVALGMRLRGTPCRVADSDQKLFVPESASYFYADLSIMCGPFEFGADDRNAVTNPRVLIEVLSPTTADYDRGTKFQHYRRLQSLSEYVLVSQDERRIEVRQRVEQGWMIRESTEGELVIPSIDVSVPFDEIYDLSGVRTDPT